MNLRISQKCCLFIAAGVLSSCVLFSIVLVYVSTNDSINNNVDQIHNYLSSSSSSTSSSSSASSSSPSSSRLHLVFSTDCSLYQHWQSYALYYSAVQVGQRGKITRLISGCDANQMEQMMQWHRQNVLPLQDTPTAKKFTLHFTPNYDHPIVKEYIYVNKPFALLHYFQYYDETATPEGFSTSAFHLQLRLTTTKLSPFLQPDDIIAVIDPDMVFLRPLSHDFTPSNTFQPVYAPGNEFDPTDPYTSTSTHNVTTVQHGHPFAPKYDVGDAWRYFNLKYITKSDTSPALNVTQEEALSHYAVGSPYMATIQDMYALTPLWLDSVATVREEFPEHISEMYSYIIGAAHANLPHHLIQNLMISGPGGSLHDTPPNEGWAFLPHIPPEQICSFATQVYKLDATTICNHTTTTTTTTTDNWKCLALQKIPNFLHFCQTYHVGDWYWNKWHIPKDYLTCESPILATPPHNLGKDYADYQLELGNRNIRNHINSYHQAQNAFMLCAMTSVLQEAALYYKKQSCNTSNVNLEQSLNIYDLYTPPQVADETAAQQQQEEQEEEEEHRRNKLILQRNDTIQNPNLYLVFHTDCTTQDHWKAYALFISAANVRQEGNIVRIVSGCIDEEQVQAMIHWYTTYIVPLSTSSDNKKKPKVTFALHFTPNYDHKIVRYHTFINKPFSILHFMEHFDDTTKDGSNGISVGAKKIQRAMNPSLDEDNNPINDDEPLQISQDNGGRNTHLEIQPFLKFDPNDVLIVLDVNMIFLQPITIHVHNINIQTEGGIYSTIVQHHQPMGAKYDIGTLWRKLDLTYITGSEDTTAGQVSEEDAVAHYMVGPPYMGSMADMYELLIPNWLKAAHAVPDEYQEFLNTLPSGGSHHDTQKEFHNELYSYIIGAAHSRLPHTIGEQLIVADATTNDFLMGLDNQDICDFLVSAPLLDVNDVCSEDEGEDKESNWKCLALRQLPNVLSYRQGYHVDDVWWFDQQLFPSNYYSCNSKITIKTPNVQSSKLSSKTHLFSICALTGVLQKSLVFFKSNYCSENMDKEQAKGLTLNEVYTMERKKQKNKRRHPYLTEEQLRTVEVTKKISIVFEDFSEAEKNHPHKGALDEDGNLGYVHNPIAIRKSPPELLLPDSEKAVCEDDNVGKVMGKVKVAPSQIKESVGVPRAKIFCTAYTIEGNHEKIPAIRETWGQRCDGFMIPSTVTNVSLDTVNILHLGEEEYWNIWQKVRSIWAYIYDHYYNDYDWFHFAGEDQYVIVENLRMYVESDTIRSAANGGKDPLLDWAQEYQTPLYLGRRLAEHARLSLQYNHGGPGYTLNKV